MSRDTALAEDRSQKFPDRDLVVHVAIGFEVAAIRRRGCCHSPIIARICCESISRVSCPMWRRAESLGSTGAPCASIRRSMMGEYSNVPICLAEASCVTHTGAGTLMIRYCVTHWWVAMGDTPTIAELEARLAEAGDGREADSSMKAGLLNEMAWRLSDLDATRAYTLAEEAYALVCEPDGSALHQPDIARSLRTLGYLNLRLGNHPLGLSQLLKALESVRDAAPHGAAARCVGRHRRHLCTDRRVSGRPRLHTSPVGGGATDRRQTADRQCAKQHG